MRASASHEPLLTKHADTIPELAGLSWRSIQNIGPSPAHIEKSQLKKITPLWLKLSLTLKRDPEADKRFGWVLEMWGYSVAAAALKIEHSVSPSFQVEPGALSSASKAK